MQEEEVRLTSTAVNRRREWMKWFLFVLLFFLPLRKREFRLLIDDSLLLLLLFLSFSFLIRQGHASFRHKVIFARCSLFSRAEKCILENISMNMRRHESSEKAWIHTDVCKKPCSMSKEPWHHTTRRKEASRRKWKMSIWNTYVSAVRKEKSMWRTKAELLQDIQFCSQV